jgi:hypothetical protein
LLLDSIDGLSSPVTSLSMVVELLEGQIDVVTTNVLHWGTQSMLVAALSHFLEHKSELELLGSRQNAYLTKDQVDALRPLVSAT